MPNKLKPTTVRRKISSNERKIQLLKDKIYSIERQIRELKIKITDIQTQCGHTHKKDDGYYNWCEDCGAAVRFDGTIIPDSEIEYPE